MAGRKKEAVAPAAPAEVSPLELRWDDAKMQSTYANVCKVFGSREEISLLFGTNSALPDLGSEPVVVLSHRIMLTPYTAKRLAQMLERGVSEYEQRFGVLKL